MFNNSTFDTQLDNQFFREKGEYIKLYRSMLCPCSSDADTSTASINCPFCGGTGRIYPEKGIRLKVVLSDAQQSAPELVAQGLAEAGDLLMSEYIEDNTPAEQYDIVIPQWGGMPFPGQLIKRGSGDTDMLFYNAFSSDECIMIDKETGNIINYTPNVDFTVSGKQITWIAENRPPQGSVYSLRYMAQFEYVVFQPSMLRRENGTDIGAKATLRKRHLVLPNLPTNYLKN